MGARTDSRVAGRSSAGRISTAAAGTGPVVVTVTAEPASEDSDGGATPWLVVGAVVLLAVLGIGTAWRTIGGPKADAEADAADVADDDPEPTARGRTPTA